VSEATGSQREAASVLFDLPGYRVLDAVDRPGQRRLVTIASTASEAACPSCGVLSARVHQRRGQRLADVPVAGPVEVVLVRRRFACTEPLCAKRTFVEVTDEVPLRARVSTRLRAVVLEAVVAAGRVVAEVAGAHGLSWWTVQRTVNAAADLLTDADRVLVRRLGVDEHRYRSVRFSRDEHGGWRRYEPWMTTLVDADTGQVLGVVDGRDSAGVGAWLGARSQAWREAVEVVAIDPPHRSRPAREGRGEHLGVEGRTPCGLCAARVPRSRPRLVHEVVADDHGIGREAPRDDLPHRRVGRLDGLPARHGVVQPEVVEDVGDGRREVVGREPEVRVRRGQPVVEGGPVREAVVVRARP
jgi:hypothetical protein